MAADHNSGSGPAAVPVPSASVAFGLALPPEIAFLEHFGVDRADLAAAADGARSTGMTADRTLLAAGVLSAERFYRYLAEHLGVAFLHDPLAVAENVSIETMMAAEIVPLAPNVTGFDVALAPQGQTLARLLERIGKERHGPAPRVVITTPRRIAALVRRRHRRVIVREASHGLSDWNPRLSALAGWSLAQQGFAFGIGFMIAVGLGISPPSTFEAVCLGFSVLFLGMVAVRLVATTWSPAGVPPMRARLPDHALPIYTVVVALYREHRVVPDLVRALARLDYPAARLDIKLVLEADDRETLEALHAEGLPDCFEVLVAPPGHPRTKPRALNVALRCALGRYLVIYDAEDVPEPGQLREAVHIFADSRAQLACLQARLAIDNHEDSWLTRLFAIEYAALFDVINPGLARLGLPVALGGTSNHFRVEALTTVNGWDAWNVTEDIDLGMRLARFGYKVGVLSTSTWEEAPNTLQAWLGQRRRWQKGWMITLKTHSRDPARLFAEMGLAGGLTAFALLTGTIASALLWPFFVFLLALDAVYGPLLAPTTVAERAWSGLALILMVSGAASLLWPAAVGLRRRGRQQLAGWLVLLPAYLVILCYATWRALFETVGRPYAWTKTEHGLAKRRPSPR